jgi:hypothetical protein
VSGERPAYKSEAYYRVVLGAGLYRGWRCVFAGCGWLQFRHEDGTDKKFYTKGMGWMSKA